MRISGLDIIKTNLESIASFRVIFLHENNFQFVCDKCHYYGWSDDWLFKIRDTPVGYGCVWGTDDRDARDTIFEFFLLPPYRKLATEIFRRFVEITGVINIEFQSNDPLLSSMAHEFSSSIVPEAILFEDHIVTNWNMPEVELIRKPIKDDNPHHFGGYVLSYRGNLMEYYNHDIASGGFLTNYNKPYADIYMEVVNFWRGHGFGSFIVQELKKEIYRMGRVPAARCGVTNSISKATLQKAGFRVCGARLKGRIRQ